MEEKKVKEARVSGEIGSWLICREYHPISRIDDMKAVMVDGKIILPHTSYRLVNGKFKKEE